MIQVDSLRAPCDIQCHTHYNTAYITYTKWQNKVARFLYTCNVIKINLFENINDRRTKLSRRRKDDGEEVEKEEEEKAKAEDESTKKKYE